MSAILHRREVHVAISGREAGKEFADAPADIQAEFLRGFLDGLDGWEPWQCWAFQCGFIGRELDENDRFRLHNRLSRLLEYLVPDPAPVS